MRAMFYVKIFLLFTLFSIVLFVYVSVKGIKNNHGIKSKTFLVKVKNNEEKDLKYILQWTSSKNVPFNSMGHGRGGFIDRKCKYNNCYVTDDRNFLGDYKKFDVIAFAGPEVAYMSFDELPYRRSPHQKYVFGSIESSDNYPVCSNRFDNYFNWTWTYKLDSEVHWGYIVIRDKDNNIIGPKKDMQWMKLEDMAPVSKEFKEKLKTKKKAAAWFVSNCYSKSGRETIAWDLKEALSKYKLELDMYGNCGNLKCSRDDEEKCDKMIDQDYYFYLSLENSMSEDYVTEKLLHALNYNAIPIVYGGANYSRFMPDGIYINAGEIGPKELAAKMNEIIANPDKYADYFRWKNHYSYHRTMGSLETNEYCRFCEILNNKDMVERTSVYKNFRQWWDPPGRCMGSVWNN